MTIWKEGKAVQDHDKDYDNFEKRYKDEVSQIRAPRDLVERTRTAMQAEAAGTRKSQIKWLKIRTGKRNSTCADGSLP